MFFLCVNCICIVLLSPCIYLYFNRLLFISVSDTFPLSLYQEARSTKAYDTFDLLARLLDFKHVAGVIVHPLQQRLLATDSLKILKRKSYY